MFSVIFVILPFILKLTGSLGIFLFGMQILSTGLQNLAGHRLQSILNWMTKNRFIGVFTGFLLTVAVQSSSASTVMIVSLVSSKLLQLGQALSVIMGANIGTTVTAWVVSRIGFTLDISDLAIPVIGIGFPLYFVRKFGKQNLGEVLIGFGLLFIGLDLLKDSIPPIDQSPALQNFIAGFVHSGVLSTLLFTFAGLVVTWVVQSSSASMTMIMTMAFAGWINMPEAAAMALGSNIGTTVTASLASIGSNASAKRAALMHFLFNTVGALWMLLFFQPMLDLVALFHVGSFGNPEMIPVNLAIFHTLFNLINTMIFLPFIRQLESILLFLIKDTVQSSPSSDYEIPAILLQKSNPETDLLNVRLETVTMLQYTEGMFEKFIEMLGDEIQNIDAAFTEMQRAEDFTDQMQECLTQYLATYTSHRTVDISEITTLIRIINEIERIGDSCLNLTIQLQRHKKSHIRFEENSFAKLLEYIGKVQQLIAALNNNLNGKVYFNLHGKELDQAKDLERALHSSRIALNKYARNRLKDGSDVKNQIIFMDIVGQLENIGNYVVNIFEAMQGIDDR